MGRNRLRPPPAACKQKQQCMKQVRSLLLGQRINWMTLGTSCFAPSKPAHASTKMLHADARTPEEHAMLPADAHRHHSHTAHEACQQVAIPTLQLTPHLGECASWPPQSARFGAKPSHHHLHRLVPKENQNMDQDDTAGCVNPAAISASPASSSQVKKAWYSSPAKLMDATHLPLRTYQGQHNRNWWQGG